jgi:hypothetical protein
MNCRVCGRQFDPQGFQVMVPGLEDAFDRVDCALEASALGPPPSRDVEPVPAVLRTLPPAAAPVPAFAGGPTMLSAAETVRPSFLAGANLALLAAGTAATIYLWLRVFGGDAGPISFPSANASAAFERSTVPVVIDLTPEPDVRPQPESAVGGGGSQPATALAPLATVSEGGGNATLASDRERSKNRSERRRNGPAARPAPTPPAPAPAPPAQPTPTRSAPVPTYPVPSSPPADRIPGPTLPGGSNPGQPTLPGGGTRG